MVLVDAPDERSGACRPERLRVAIRGAVQGVGFRPFVFRLATGLALEGWVTNGPRGVTLEVQGPRDRLEEFVARLIGEHPPQARVQAIEREWLPAANLAGFEIRASEEGGAPSTIPLPDLATCEACLAEVLDPADRRHRYPFANCTRCGPRFTILEALPYDRPRTTMRGFPLCAPCRAEYESPRDRRFHAQPIACPACGPALTLADRAGAPLARGDAALLEAAAALRGGRIVAVKGLGGYHLMCDAADAAAVARIRAGKGRVAKPFALMARDLDQARALCVVEARAARALAAAEAPILLLPRRPEAAVAPGVAPGCATLGVMLPATPLHHLLMREVARPLVATSGNLADEPIATREDQARDRLGAIADLWLAHDRPIARHMDDSVAWIVGGELALLRRARGFAPLPVALPRETPVVLATGAHQKGTIALAIGRQAFVSQHLGDLDTEEARAAFEATIEDFLRLYRARPAAIAHDLHPDYASTRWAARAAERLAIPAIAVQHHHAHLAACLAEHGEERDTLGVTWDGTGYGEDGTIWGGEFLRGGAAEFERAAHLLPFRLPGGERAVREPRRVALALLWNLLGDEAFERLDLAVVRSLSRTEREIWRRLLARGLHAPVTTSAGRLFDGAAALAGLCFRASYEGQAAAALEVEAGLEDHGAYPIDLAPPRRTPRPGTRASAGDLAAASRPSANGAGAPDVAPLILDWRPAIAAMVADLVAGVPRPAIAARFHDGLAEAIVAVAGRLGAERVALTGGCFQNRRLLETASRRLAAAGHRLLVHRQVPPNDGGVSLGQIAVAAARLAEGAEIAVPDRPGS